MPRHSLHPLPRSLAGGSGGRSQNRGLASDEAIWAKMDRAQVLGRGREGHTGCVNALSWSDDGSTLLSGSDDKRICIWSPNDSPHPNTISPHPLKFRESIVTGHRANIFSARYLPNASTPTIVTCAGDRDVRVLEVERLGRAETGMGSGTGNGNSIGMLDGPRRDELWGVSGPGVTVLKCHRDRTKRIATENSPFLFLTVSEDGTVRQHDLRRPHQCRSECPDALFHAPRGVDLYSLSVSTVTPHIFAVAGRTDTAFVCDRRMLERQTPSWGTHTRQSGNVHCVRRLGLSEEDWQSVSPRGAGGRFSGERHVTCVKMSPEHADEVICAFARHSTSLFSLYDSPESSSAKKRSLSPTITHSSRAVRHRSGSTSRTPPSNPANATEFLRSSTSNVPRSDPSVTLFGDFVNSEPRRRGSGPAVASPVDRTEVEVDASRSAPISFEAAFGEIFDAGREDEDDADDRREMQIEEEEDEELERTLQATFQQHRERLGLPPLHSDPQPSVRPTGGSSAAAPGAIGSRGIGRGTGTSRGRGRSSLHLPPPRAHGVHVVEDEENGVSVIPRPMHDADPVLDQFMAAMEADEADWADDIGEDVDTLDDGVDYGLFGGNGVELDEDDVDGIDDDDLDEVDEEDEDEDDDEDMFDEEDDDDEDELDQDYEDYIDGLSDPRSADGEFASVPMILPRQSYKGARNYETVKDCNFLGFGLGRSDKVCSGSDDGNWFVWDKASGRVDGVWEGDGSVVNVMEQHPTLPLVAVSGIDNTVKIFSPLSSPPSPSFSRLSHVDDIIRRNSAPPNSRFASSLSQMGMLNQLMAMGVLAPGMVDGDGDGEGGGDGEEGGGMGAANQCATQ